MDDRFGDRRTNSRGQDSRQGGSRGGQPFQGASGGYSSPASHQSESEVCTRLEGFVVTLKEAYGFVQAADSETQHFFHYSELRNSSHRDLRTGSELAYDVYEPRNGEKPTAINISLLPKGSIKLETVIAVDLRGSVHKEPKAGSDRRDKKDASTAGRIKTLPEQKALNGEPAPDSAVFSIEDAVNLEDGSPYKPRTEDEVLFDMVVVRATRQRRAVNVRLVKAKVDPRETGLVSTLKDSFGFIQCCDRDERLFFHNSEMLDRRYALREGDEVEFTVEKDKEGRNVGKSIKVLPPGSVSFVTVLGKGIVGTVEREMRVSSKKGGRGSGIMTREDSRGGKELFGGLVVCEFGGEELRLPFDGQDVDIAAPLKGDQVQISVCIHKPTKKKQATNIRILSFGREGREQGVVTKWKEGLTHAFIRCCDREEPLFFHVTELLGESVSNGMEVEFNVVESRSDSRPMAVRITKLAPGTVSFETVLPGPFEGTILRSVPMTAGPALRQPHGKKKAPKENVMGLIVALTPLTEASSGRAEEKGVDVGREGTRESGHGRCYMDQTEETEARRGEGMDRRTSEVGYGWADQEDPAAVLRKGDTVSFALHIDRPTKTRSLPDPHSAAQSSLRFASCKLTAFVTGARCGWRLRRSGAVTLRRQARLVPRMVSLFWSREGGGSYGAARETHASTSLPQTWTPRAWRGPGPRISHDPSRLLGPPADPTRVTARRLMRAGSRERTLTRCLLLLLMQRCFTFFFNSSCVALLGMI